MTVEADKIRNSNVFVRSLSLVIIISPKRKSDNRNVVVADKM